MKWIYLSPHLDDAVYSCGGIIWEQVQSGQPVEVWTLFAGDPIFPLSDLAETLHRRWEVSEDATIVRRAEDLEACRLLGAAARHFPLSDVIYRRSPVDDSPIIRENEELFHPIHPNEAPLVDYLRQLLEELVPRDAQIACPLTLGGHMDHRLVRAAAEVLHYPLWFYADFPYAAQDSDVPQEWSIEPVKEIRWQISAGGLEAWKQAAAAYRSQISTFWHGEAQMREELQQYWEKGGGQALWKSGE